MTRHLLFVLIGLTLVAGCARRKPPEITTLPTEGLYAHWHADLDLQHSKLAGLYLADPFVFAYTDQHEIYALDRNSGELIFKVRIEKPAEKLHAPVVMKAVPTKDPNSDQIVPVDMIIFPTDYTLQVYNWKGRFLHERKVTFNIRSNAVGMGNRAFMGGDFQNGARIVAVEVTGTPYTMGPVWQNMGRGAFTSRPALFQGVLFAGCRDHRVYAMSADTGAPAWPRWSSTDYGFPTDDRVLADVKADKDGVFAASVDTKLYCLDPGSGVIRWQFFAGEELHEQSEPYLTKDTVYIYVPNRGVAAVDKASNGPRLRDAKWMAPEGRMFLAQDERYAYVLNKDGHIIAVDRAASGKNGIVVKFKSVRSDFSFFAPNEADGFIYVASGNGQIYGIRPINRRGGAGEITQAGPALDILLAAR